MGIFSRRNFNFGGGGASADESSLRVELQVQAKYSNGEDGFNQNQTVKGVNYSCRFTGGTDSKGGVTVYRGSGKKVISVGLLNSNNYSIKSVKFTGTGAEEFTLAPNSMGNKIFIDFRNVGEAAIKYSVFVIDRTTDNVVDCDPPVRNVT